LLIDTWSWIWVPQPTHNRETSPRKRRKKKEKRKKKKKRKKWGKMEGKNTRKLILFNKILPKVFSNMFAKKKTLSENSS
jgi:hypothetical protein